MITNELIVSIEYKLIEERMIVMVDGINMVFSKEKMIERVKNLGMMHMVGDVELKMMDNLDGCPVSSSSWNRRVNNEPVYSCFGKDGKYYDVNENDCVVV